MSKKRRAAKKSEGTCVYCGRIGPVTDDHLFPSTIFHQPDPQMVIVAACNGCNQLKSLGDRDLRNLLVMDIGGSQHPDTLELTERMLRKENVRIRNWVRRLLETAEEVDLVSEEGIILGQAFRFEFNQERMIRSQEMTIRGLYFHETRTILPPDCPVYVEHVPWQVAPQVVKGLSQAAPTKWTIKGHYVAAWGFNRIDGGTDVETAWQVAYNNWVLFVGATGETATRMRMNRETFDVQQRDRPKIVNLGRPRVVVPKDPEGRRLLPRLHQPENPE